MIELLFSDSAAASLARAKRDGTGAAITSMKITASSDGSLTAEPVTPEPYSGPFVDGSPSDIASLWLMADVGDISDLPVSHLGLLERIKTTYIDQYDWVVGGDWAQEETKRAVALADRLRRAADSKEPVRIWWSDAPGETCGFYWAMDILEESAGAVTSVKIPAIYPTGDGFVSFGGTGALSPEWVCRLLELERAVEIAERKAAAFEWRRLVSENAPLRALLNGRLHSVPVDFYDFALRRAMPGAECRVAFLIGNAVSRGPNGVSDWWYAWRLMDMISAGEVKLVEAKGTFYTSIIKFT